MAIYEYKMDHKERGTCVIINNKDFKNNPEEYPYKVLKPRPGSDKDASNMQELFESLGFKVTVEVNQTKDQILQIALNVGTKVDHTDEDCFVMVILSHGGDLGVIWGVDEMVLLEHIFDPIKYCKTLRGKPKLFFIQACRGAEVDDGAELEVEYEEDGGTESDNKKTQSIPLQADFLYAYSTPPGHLSFRNEANGSWFMQAIYKVFTQHSSTMEILRMMTRVNHMVAYEFTSQCKNLKRHKKKQVSSVVTMLTKELYFTPK